MQLALSMRFAPPPILVRDELSGNLLQGFTTKNQDWNPGPNVVNSTTAIGLRASLFLEGVRQSHSARYYNPTTGRFMGRDPEVGNRLDPASLHKYLYAGGDPVDSIDPSGRASILETGSLNAVIGSAPVPALIELAGTAAENAALATGVSDAIAGIQLAAEAGSWEEVVNILGYTARAIIKSRPLVRVFLCAPVALAYNFAEDQLNEYAKDHKWTFLEIQAMDSGLDKGKEALVGVCAGFVASGGK